VTAAVSSPRNEPLLWLQLLGLGVLPAEALLLLLLLAGSDPGPLPALERVLCWAVGSLAPALLLWRQPADVWSLLLVQVPLRGRTPIQRQLSSLQDTTLLRAGLVLGCTLSLPLLWWLDSQAALASAFSPLAGSPRLIALLLTAAVLALMLWQWQQLLQALWLLSRTPAQTATAVIMPLEQTAQVRLVIGLPLLLIEPLRGAEALPSALDAGVRVPVDPEQRPADQESPGLDQQIG